ncbi:MAG: hypothetical protein IKS87_01695 [Lachnospiraceae bacterium]|nr:hypothetical protein [Lachnospiraceae bacterium]
MNGKGFIKIPRALLNEWRDTLTAEEVGILIYLTAAANYQDKPMPAPKGDLLERGQLAISLRTLAKRFGISKNKAARLLTKWERLGLIKRETISETETGTYRGTLLTLEFYASSQGMQDRSRDGRRDINGDSIRKEEKTKKVEEVPPPPFLYGSYHNISLTAEELKDLKTHIPSDLFDARINKASQGIKDGWHGYRGSHFEIIRKWAIADGCWIDNPGPPVVSKIEMQKMDLVNRFGRDKYERAVATINTDDPHKVKRYLENKMN